VAVEAFQDDLDVVDVESHLVDAVFHRGMRAAGVSPGAFTLSASFFTSVFSQLSLESQSTTMRDNGG
jgi:hypothetical protein